MSKKKHKKTKTTKVTYTPPPIAGFLIDTRGVIHDLTQAAVSTLEEAVEPVSKMAIDNGKQLPLWAVDKDGDRFFQNTTKINDCVYRAIKKYLDALGIGTLTSGDLAFFESHPRVNGDGVNNANVLCVTQGLLIPWGLGITKIWVPAGTSLGDQHKEFAGALGINPMGLADYTTDNEAFIEFLNLPPGGEQAIQIRQSFNFEFAENPIGPCVVMLSNWSGGNTTGSANVSGQWSSSITTTGMGHADFVGPRDKLYGDWRVAFRIGPLPKYADNGINRYADIDLAFGEAEVSTKFASMLKFSVWQSLIKGRSINAWQAELRAARAVSTVVQQTGTSKVNGGVVRRTTSDLPIRPARVTTPCPECDNHAIEIDGMQYCLTCDWYTDLDNVVAEAEIDVCPFCYTDMSDGIVCDNTKCGFDKSLWQKSTYHACATHGDALYFKRRGEEEPDSGLDGLYCYACADCLFEKDEDLKGYAAAAKTHTDYVETKPLPGEEENNVDAKYLPA